MFSVIIPVYNGEKFIDNAIESVFAQTCNDWELVIVDDGSKDDTLSVLQKYESDPRVHIVSQPNAGVSAARNTAASHASGSHLAFLDADDVWHSDHLETMAELIDRYPSAGLYATFTRAELVNGNIIEECNFFKDKPQELILEDFFESYHKDKSAKMFTVITTCIRADAFKKAGGFPVGCKIGEDLELSLVVAAYYPVVLCAKATATYKKENSTATKDVSFDADWGFFHRVQALYSDETIPLQKRKNLQRVMEWFTMRRCRHYLIDGRRKEALAAYHSMDKSVVGKKDTLINAVLLALPGCVVKKVFELRWRGKA